MTVYQLSEFLGILVQTQIHISFRNIWLNHKKQCNGNMRTLWLICVLIYRPRFFFCSFFQSVEKVCWVKGLVVLSNKFVFSDFWFGFHSYSATAVTTGSIHFLHKIHHPMSDTRGVQGALVTCPQRSLPLSPTNRKVQVRQFNFFFLWFDLTFSIPPQFGYGGKTS